MGIGLVEESSVAVWVGDVSLTLSTLVYCVGSNARQCPDTWASLDGNDLLPRHVSRVYYLLGTSRGRWWSWDDYSHMMQSHGR